MVSKWCIVFGIAGTIALGAPDERVTESEVFQLLTETKYSKLAPIMDKLEIPQVTMTEAEAVYRQVGGAFDVRHFRTFIAASKNHSLEIEDSNGTTLLETAIKRAVLFKKDANQRRLSLSMIIYLLRAGASPDRTAAVTLALETKDAEIVNHLLAGKANLALGPDEVRRAFMEKAGEELATVESKKLSDDELYSRLSDPAKIGFMLVAAVEMDDKRSLTSKIGKCPRLVKTDKGFKLAAKDGELKIFPYPSVEMPYIIVEVNEDSYRVDFDSEIKCVQTFTRWRDILREAKPANSVELTLEDGE